MRADRTRLALAAVAVLVVLVCPAFADAQTRYVYLYDPWRYDASGTDLGTAWRAPGYDDSGWATGTAPLGYGPGLSFETDIGETISPSTRTVYFRSTFDVADASAVSAIVLHAVYAQGMVVYLNGTEVARRAMPVGTVGYDTAAMAHTPTDFEDIDLTASRSVLVNGENVLAIEVHQTSPPADLVVWATELRYALSSFALLRGPYLQSGTPDATVVRFRTNQPVVGTVRFGTTPDTLDGSVSEPAATTDHELRLGGLAPATRYCYSVGSEGVTLAGGDDAHCFVTSPPAGSTSPVRIWALGDSGTARPTMRAVRDAYLEYTGTRGTDVWLMLGDNAYPAGSDDDHQLAIFENAFEDTARSHPLWPTFGNHEWGDGTNDPHTEAGPYFDIFSLPENGEAGGEPSGHEVYYSFDYGNVHFVCLNTHEPDPPILPWMEADLVGTDQPWIVAFFHVPPYTKGTHDSDAGGHELSRALAEVLEGYGVDLVLAGHSHVYERSMLLDGHYGDSSELAVHPELILDDGDGREDGDGAYRKPAVRGPHQGTVYVVAGNAGGRAGEGTVASLDHPAMVELVDPSSGETRRGLLAPGSLAIDVDDDRLDAAYVDATGAVLDHFTILKGGAPTEVDAGPRFGDDGGPPLGADAGTVPRSDDGGCCSVAPGARRRSLAPACLVLALSLLVAGRRRRR